LAFVTSFATILVMWVNHHRLFTLVHRTTGAFLFLNGLLLFFVTVVPFPTALVSQRFLTADAKTATAIYSGTYFATAIAFNALWRYASAKRRLIDPRSKPEQAEAMTRNYNFGLALYLLAFVLAFFSIFASLALCTGLAVFFAVTGSAEKNR